MLVHYFGNGLKIGFWRYKERIENAKGRSLENVDRQKSNTM